MQERDVHRLDLADIPIGDIEVDKSFASRKGSEERSHVGGVPSGDIQ
ncbi:hypothetical protein SDC9_196941 [bioreactor metagenome]|uniref:Uncharacterized protein n=1 Tax=bioreactor metagenome TaxID=1076179 RepID=A0A645IQ03_9ZZZZ